MLQVAELGDLVLLEDDKCSCCQGGTIGSQTAAHFGPKHLQLGGQNPTLPSENETKKPV